MKVKRIALGIASMLGVACSSQSRPTQPVPTNQPQAKVSHAKILGTWHDGFKAGYAKGLTFTSWDEMRDWADGGEGSYVLPLRTAMSTDYGGGRHSYIDTYAAGFRDARIGISAEMRFIGNHNSGDIAHFFVMTKEWIEMQTPDDVIPPGHF